MVQPYFSIRDGIHFAYLSIPFEYAYTMARVCEHYGKCTELA